MENLLNESPVTTGADIDALAELGIDEEQLAQALDVVAGKPTGRLLSMGYNVAPAVDSTWNGEKFFGGYGLTKILAPDYWTLRERSNELFTSNLYARGLIRRLVTNEINTGLAPEAMPDAATLGLDQAGLDDWAEDVEQRFLLWAKTPTACDFKKTETFNKIQATVRREALVAGDVLVVLQQDPTTKRPSVLIVKGDNVRNPVGGNALADANKNGRSLQHGVEMDSVGRHVAYHILQRDGSSRRVPAIGSRSGRRVAWLVYGTDKRADTVRGMPLLGLILQSLKELDRYRDSAQRAAVVNSMIAMFITKTEDKPGTKPISGGAVKKSSFTVNDNPSGTREVSQSLLNPGMVLEELQQGEEPKAFQPNVDVNLGPFEAGIINAIAWANEVPPEILTLAFSNNYSASMAALNEFKIYLNMFRTDFGEQFCAPVYKEWLISEALLDKVGQSTRIVTAWQDKANFEIFAAWTLAEWSGAIKPATDIVKQASGYKQLVDAGFITNARATRETTGQKFSAVMRQQERENQLKVKAMQPLVDFQNANPAAANSVEALGDIRQQVQALADMLADMGVE